MLKTATLMILCFFELIDNPIIAVLDWELSTLRHPFADLTYQCMTLRLLGGIGKIPSLQGVDRDVSEYSG